MNLKIDPTACIGNGVCHELVPELIDLDEWGFPILRTTGPSRTAVEVPGYVYPHAKRAVAACPRIALKLAR